MTAHVRWSAEAEATLLRLWDAGGSATLIGEVLGISRNAVLGKVHRLGKARNLPPKWDEQKNAELRRLWTEGLSLSAIGEALGVTKGAATARAKKMKLLGTRSVARPVAARPAAERKAPRLRVRPGPRAAAGARRAAAEAQPVFTLGDDGALPGRAPISLLARKIGAECCWPIGDPRDPGFGVCGAPVASEGRSYCHTHALRARGVPEAHTTPPVNYRKTALARVF